MAREVDMTGQVFGELTVIRRVPSEGFKAEGARWLCKCSCGREHTARGNVIRLGNVRSCGCRKAVRLKGKCLPSDLSGQRFGLLTAISPEDARTNGGKVMWLCKCDCGQTAVVRGTDLSAGNTKSCGCLRRKKAAP